jgi:hypothetical protein
VRPAPRRLGTRRSSGPVFIEGSVLIENIKKSGFDFEKLFHHPPPAAELQALRHRRATGFRDGRDATEYREGIVRSRTSEAEFDVYSPHQHRKRGYVRPYPWQAL